MLQVKNLTAKRERPIVKRGNRLNLLFKTPTMVTNKPRKRLNIIAGSEIDLECKLQSEINDRIHAKRLAKSQQRSDLNQEIRRVLLKETREM